jgi:beta-glucosidase
LRLEDNPSWLNVPGEQGHVRYSEGVFVGYRYYTTAGVKVRYPFGHGLSYTTFATSNLELETLSDDSLTVHATVTNTGNRSGKHVVQVYVATATGPVRRPTRERRTFTKFDLQAGESKQVALTLDRRAFAYWDVELDRWIVPAGGYTIQVCSDASTVLAEEEVTLAGDSIIRELTLDSTVGDWFGHPAVGPALMAGLTASMTEEQAKQAQENNDQLKMVESMPMQQFLAFTNGLFPAEALEALMELSKNETAAS